MSNSSQQASISGQPFGRPETRLSLSHRPELSTARNDLSALAIVTVDHGGVCLQVYATADECLAAAEAFAAMAQRLQALAPATPIPTPEARDSSFGEFEAAVRAQGRQGGAA